MERSGNGLHGVGSITAFYTVLSEGDDQQDPITDAARAILDGHIVLSRALAEMGHFPAIDIEQSASRVMHNVVSREHFELARQFRATYSRYQKSRDLVQVGAYMSGSDPQLDDAIRRQPAMAAFLQQGMFDASSMDESCAAMAQREIALAIGEPPATKGYPPSCFAKLPALVERSGNGLHGVGSITAFYTVLSEGDDQQDPIADAARAILDGHIVLSRALAETGHFPAIDIEQSASRVMHNVVSRGHFDLARRFRAVYSRYQKSRDLVQVGAYMSGSDPALDEAIRLQPQMAAFLQQDMFDAASMEQSLHTMAVVLDH